MKASLTSLALLCVLASYSQSNWKAFARSVFKNKNVYKSQSNFGVISSYETKDRKPDGSINATVSVRPGHFIRYTIVAEEGGKTYIKLLPTCKYDVNMQQITIAENEYVRAKDEINPTNYIYEVATNSLSPNNHYLASSALIGKVVTIPVRFRKEKRDVEKNWSVEGSLNIGYAFGWKVKIGDNPYKRNYMNVIPYTLGVSSQKYFAITKSVLTNKDSVTAKTDQIAFTYYAGGIAYETDKFNIGIFAGVDKMFGKSKDWVYQNRWWWGIGIGYELFK